MENIITSSIKIRRKVLKEILDNAEDNEEALQQIELRMDELSPKHITIEDMFASMNYVINCVNNILLYKRNIHF